MEESWRKLKEAQDSLREFFSSYGYQVIDTPILEPTELFLRKSGGELASRLYTFTDPGGQQVSLRPEFTSSIMRHFLEMGGETPFRVQYAGPVFRYEGGREEYRQFIQVGVELLGYQGPQADAELLSLASSALSHLGIRGYQLLIGDVGVFARLLDGLELSERAKAFILGSIPQLREGPPGLARVQERAQQLHLLRSNLHATQLGALLKGLEDREARELLGELFLEAGTGPLGGRGLEEITERFLRKLRSGDEPARVERGLHLACDLVRVRGEPVRALDEARAVISSYHLDTGVLEELGRTVELLDLEHIPDSPVALDFGLVRGIAYYTGIVFEVSHPALGASLGGGGRYDGLARALGGPRDVPALGFAYTLERLLEAREAGFSSPGGG